MSIGGFSKLVRPPVFEANLKIACPMHIAAEYVRTCDRRETICSSRRKSATVEPARVTSPRPSVRSRRFSPVARSPREAPLTNRQQPHNRRSAYRSSCPEGDVCPSPGIHPDQAGKQSLDGASNFLSKTGPANELDLTSHCHSPPVDRTERSRTRSPLFRLESHG